MTTADNDIQRALDKKRKKRKLTAAIMRSSEIQQKQLKFESKFNLLECLQFVCLNPIQMVKRPGSLCVLKCDIMSFDITLFTEVIAL